MQCAILDALPPRPGASEGEKAAQREGALDFLAALHPRNPVEATIASGIVAAYYAAMDCFRRAARGDLTVDLHLRTVAKAIALCRMIDVGMRDLARRQGGLGVQPAARPALARPELAPARSRRLRQPGRPRCRSRRWRRDGKSAGAANAPSATPPRPHSGRAGARVPRTLPRSSGSSPSSPPPVPRPPPWQPRCDGRQDPMHRENSGASGRGWSS
jgi:hypothetical protein